MLCFRCPHAISLTTCGYTSPHDIYIHDLYTLHVHVYAITTYLSLHHNHTHILYLHAYAHTHQGPQAHVFSLYTIQPSEPPIPTIGDSETPLHSVHRYALCMKEKRG